MNSHFLRKVSPVVSLFLMIFFVITQSAAREFKGVTFPDEIKIDNKNCTLNGIGLRKKLVINVYLGALYLENKSTSDKEIIGSEQTKRIIMHFLYKEVSAKQLTEAWDEGFKKNSPNSLNTIKSKIDKFQSMFQEPVKKGDTIILTYVPDKGTTIEIKNSVKGVIEGKDFMEALFSIWLGPNPPSSELKDGMTGKNK